MTEWAWQLLYVVCSWDYISVFKVSFLSFEFFSQELQRHFTPYVEVAKFVHAAGCVMKKKWLTQGGALHFGRPMIEHYRENNTDTSKW